MCSHDRLSMSRKGSAPARKSSLCFGAVNPLTPWQKEVADILSRMHRASGIARHAQSVGVSPSQKGAALQSPASPNLRSCCCRGALARALGCQGKAAVLPRRARCHLELSRQSQRQVLPHWARQDSLYVKYMVSGLHPCVSGLGLSSSL